MFVSAVYFDLLRALRLFLQFQNTHAGLLSVQLGRRQSVFRIHFSQRLQSFLFRGANRTLLVQRLAMLVESSVRPRETPHISQRLLQLGFIDFSQTSQSIVRAFVECHSGVVIICLGHFLVEEKWIINSLVDRRLALSFMLESTADHVCQALQQRDILLRPCHSVRLVASNDSDKLLRDLVYSVGT